jgi:hypothetical protein
MNLGRGVFTSLKEIGDNETSHFDIVRIAQQAARCSVVYEVWYPTNPA